MRSCTAFVVSAFVLLSSSILAKAGPPRRFVFTQTDEKFFNEAEAIDRQFEKKGLVFKDPTLDARVEELVKPMLASVGTPGRVRWMFRILRDPAVNAFALPNGSVYVDTGLLAVLENDAQLVGILGREVAHV